MPKLRVLDLIADPARIKELINPEFVADGPFLLLRNKRGEVGYRYDALPASVAAEPTAFGCIVCEAEGHRGAPTLKAMLWDGARTVLHTVSSSLVPAARSTPTMAEGRAESIRPAGSEAA